MTAPPELDMAVVLTAVAAMIVGWMALGVLTVLIGQWAIRRPMSWLERAACVVFTAPALATLYRFSERVIREGYYVITGHQ